VDLTERQPHYDTLAQAQRTQLQAHPIDVSDFRRKKVWERTRRDVELLRGTPGGCCDDYADFRGCDCMRRAAPDSIPGRE